jgi:hypothetical protein
VKAPEKPLSDNEMYDGSYAYDEEPHLRETKKSMASMHMDNGYGRYRTLCLGESLLCVFFVFFFVVNVLFA